MPRASSLRGTGSSGSGVGLRLAGLDDPEQANIAAAEGRALLQTGDRIAARAALLRALRVNPFIPTLHCDLARLAETTEERTREQALCRE